MAKSKKKKPQNRDGAIQMAHRGEISLKTRVIENKKRKSSLYPKHKNFKG